MGRRPAPRRKLFLGPRRRRPRADRGWRVAIAWAAALGLAACARAEPIALFDWGDTQTYAFDFGEKGQMPAWRAMAEWLCTHGAERGLRAVLAPGDVVQHGRDAQQWARAREVYDRLDACGIPYVIAIGNHDQDWNAEPARPGVKIHQFLAFLERVDDAPSTLAGRGPMRLVRLAPGWVALTLGWWMEPADWRWAREQLVERAGDDRVILLQHGLVYRVGERMRLLKHAERVRALSDELPHIDVLVGGHWIGDVRDGWGRLPTLKHRPLLVFANYQHEPGLSLPEQRALWGWGTWITILPEEERICVGSENILTGARDYQTPRACFDL